MSKSKKNAPESAPAEQTEVVEHLEMDGEPLFTPENLAGFWEQYRFLLLITERGTIRITGTGHKALGERFERVGVDLHKIRSFEQFILAYEKVVTYEVQEIERAMTERGFDPNMYSDRDKGAA